MEVDKIIVDELQPVEETASLVSVPDQKTFMPVGNGRVSKHQMGKRGSKHEHKPTFKSRQILPMSAAQYRRYHFGAKNKKKEG